MLSLAAVVAGCGGGKSTRSGSAELETISSVAQFQRTFDAKRGTARLVVLLSPT